MKLCIAIVFVSSAVFAQDDFELPFDTNPRDPINFPSRHAWSLFFRVNHPARPIAEGRGVPDLEKEIGAPGTTVVWETWRLASEEVFLAPPEMPPNDFHSPPDPSLPPGGKVPEINKSLLLTRLEEQGRFAPDDSAHVRFDPDEGLFDPQNPQGGFGESRMNKATYDFILREGLYNRQGIINYAAKYFAKEKPPISFPEDSMEVKAAWIRFQPEDLASGKHERFYLAEYEGETYGLTSLHIITKDIPNWFWCTFHHKEIPAGEETPDTFGQPKELKGTVWENYELGGTQIEFVNSVGKPTLLSDAYIEYGFTESSCISCHAGAAVNENGIPILGSNPSSVGSPNLNDYERDGEPILMQLDFLFSVAFRAK